MGYPHVAIESVVPIFEARTRNVEQGWRRQILHPLDGALVEAEAVGDLVGCDPLT